MNEIQRRLALPADRVADHSLVLGLAVQLLQWRWSGVQVAQQLDRLFAALDAGQYEFYFDASTRVVGFAAWVLVSPEVSSTLVQRGPEAVAPTQWCGGTQLWIVDLVSRDGSLPYMLAHLRDVRLAAHDQVTYFRYKRRLRIARQLTRQDRTSFFQRSPSLPARHALTNRQDLLENCSRRWAKARLLGVFLQTLRRGDPRRRSALWQSTFRISEIIALRLYRSYAQEQKPATGLLTWAWLSERSIARIAEQPLHSLHSSEWNEGDTLCLCDAVVGDGVRHHMEADVLGALFPEEANVLIYLAPAAGAPARLVRVDRQRQSAALLQWLGGANAESHSVSTRLCHD